MLIIRQDLRCDWWSASLEVDRSSTARDAGFSLPLSLPLTHKRLPPLPLSVQIKMHGTAIFDLPLADTNSFKPQHFPAKVISAN